MSSDRAQRRLQILPPGDYVLTIDLSPKFAVYQRSGIRIGAGETVELTAVLQVAGIVESVTVQANADMSPRTSGMESRFGVALAASEPTPGSATVKDEYNGAPERSFPARAPDSHVRPPKSTRRVEADIVRVSQRRSFRKATMSA